MDRKKVLVYRGLPAQELERVRAEHDVIEADPRQEAQEQAFFEALPFVHGLIGSGYRIDDSLLARAPLLKVISTISVGIDHFALDAMKKRGVTLCHTPGVLTEAVADLTFALILGTSRRVLELGRYVQQGRWRRSITAAQYGWDVHGKTLGILGYGRIGKAVARRAALGFGMPVLYYTRSAVDSGLPEGKACPASLNDVLAQSDFLVVMLPLTEATRGMIGPAQLAMMKPEAILINAARGPVVQEDALLDALDHGRLRAAGLDVFDTEPLPADSPLRDHPSVLALPHAGSATHETRAAMAHMAVDNLLCVLRGDTPPAAYPLDKAD
ncbi:D-glycerate dehydrogenase [Allopusillimonas soli]|uniref:D-glycerate dehydrogenase n=1 Tax=Allopusillimonas soli TaxID=659016 RepID=A0A853FII0_9BURK|nr:D-glycerate dehydrogenase [Allopusillimonas soli]NYT38231.1 D-glycerate dehydrogenase [Allopusillimonas soli]TEA72190.1 D-glycerate dehydrogenase [Allopusillimonas soli]